MGGTLTCHQKQTTSAPQNGEEGESLAEVVLERKVVAIGQYHSGYVELVDAMGHMIPSLSRDSIRKVTVKVDERQVNNACALQTSVKNIFYRLAEARTCQSGERTHSFCLLLD